MSSFNQLSPLLHKNAHIIFSVGPNGMLDTKQDELKCRGWLCRQIYHILDWVTGERFSEQRITTVHTIMLDTLTGIKDHLHTFDTLWKQENALPNAHPNQLSACSQLVTFSKNATYCTTEPFSELRKKISESKDLEKDVNASELIQIANEISAIAQAIKETPSKIHVHDDPVPVSAGMPQFEVLMPTDC